MSCFYRGPGCWSQSYPPYCSPFVNDCEFCGPHSTGASCANWNGQALFGNSCCARKLRLATESTLLKKKSFSKRVAEETVKDELKIKRKQAKINKKKIKRRKDAQDLEIMFKALENFCDPKQCGNCENECGKCGKKLGTKSPKSRSATSLKMCTSSTSNFSSSDRFNRKKYEHQESSKKHRNLEDKFETASNSSERSIKPGRYENQKRKLENQEATKHIDTKATTERKQFNELEICDILTDLLVSKFKAIDYTKKMQSSIRSSPNSSLCCSKCICDVCKCLDSTDSNEVESKIVLATKGLISDNRSKGKTVDQNGTNTKNIKAPKEILTSDISQMTTKSTRRGKVRSEQKMLTDASTSKTHSKNEEETKSYKSSSKGYYSEIDDVLSEPILKKKKKVQDRNKLGKDEKKYTSPEELSSGSSLKKSILHTRRNNDSFQRELSAIKAKERTAQEMSVKKSTRLLQETTVRDLSLKKSTTAPQTPKAQDISVRKSSRLAQDVSPEKSISAPQEPKAQDISVRKSTRPTQEITAQDLSPEKSISAPQEPKAQDISVRKSTRPTQEITAQDLSPEKSISAPQEATAQNIRQSSRASQTTSLIASAQKDYDSRSPSRGSSSSSLIEEHYQSTKINDNTRSPAAIPSVKSLDRKTSTKSPDIEESVSSSAKKYSITTDEKLADTSSDKRKSTTSPDNRKSNTTSDITKSTTSPDKRQTAGNSKSKSPDSKKSTTSPDNRKSGTAEKSGFPYKKDSDVSSDNKKSDTSARRQSTDSKKLTKSPDNRKSATPEKNQSPYKKESDVSSHNKKSDTSARRQSTDNKKSTTSPDNRKSGTPVKSQSPYKKESDVSSDNKKSDTSARRQSTDNKKSATSPGNRKLDTLQKSQYPYKKESDVSSDNKKSDTSARRQSPDNKKSTTKESSPTPQLENNERSKSKARSFDNISPIRSPDKISSSEHVKESCNKNTCTSKECPAKTTKKSRTKERSTEVPQTKPINDTLRREENESSSSKTRSPDNISSVRSPDKISSSEHVKEPCNKNTCTSKECPAKTTKKSRTKERSTEVPQTKPINDTLRREENESSSSKTRSPDNISSVRSPDKISSSEHVKESCNKNTCTSKECPAKTSVQSRPKERSTTVPQTKPINDTLRREENESSSSKTRSPDNISSVRSPDKISSSKRVKEPCTMNTCTSKECPAKASKISRPKERFTRSSQTDPINESQQEIYFSSWSDSKVSFTSSQRKGNESPNSKTRSPDNIPSVRSPDKISSLRSPDKISPVRSPDKISFATIPEKISFSKLPVKRPNKKSHLRSIDRKPTKRSARTQSITPPAYISAPDEFSSNERLTEACNIQTCTSTECPYKKSSQVDYSAKKSAPNNLPIRKTAKSTKVESSDDYISTSSDITYVSSSSKKSSNNKKTTARSVDKNKDITSVINKALTAVRAPRKKLSKSFSNRKNVTTSSENSSSIRSKVRSTSLRLNNTNKPSKSSSDSKKSTTSFSVKSPSIGSPVRLASSPRLMYDFRTREDAYSAKNTIVTKCDCKCRSSSKAKTPAQHMKESAEVKISDSNSLMECSLHSCKLPSQIEKLNESALSDNISKINRSTSEMEDIRLTKVFLESDYNEQSTTAGSSKRTEETARLCFPEKKRCKCVISQTDEDSMPSDINRHMNEPLATKSPIRAKSNESDSTVSTTSQMEHILSTKVFLESEFNAKSLSAGCKSSKAKTTRSEKNDIIRTDNTRSCFPENKPCECGIKQADEDSQMNEDEPSTKLPPSTTKENSSNVLTTSEMEDIPLTKVFLESDFIASSKKAKTTRSEKYYIRTDNTRSCFPENKPCECDIKQADKETDEEEPSTASPTTTNFNKILSTTSATSQMEDIPLTKVFLESDFNENITITAGTKSAKFQTIPKVWTENDSSNRTKETKRSSCSENERVMNECDNNRTKCCTSMPCLSKTLNCVCSKTQTKDISRELKQDVSMKTTVFHRCLCANYPTHYHPCHTHNNRCPCNDEEKANRRAGQSRTENREETHSSPKKSSSPAEHSPTENGGCKCLYRAPHSREMNSTNSKPNLCALLKTKMDNLTKQPSGPNEGTFSAKTDKRRAECYQDFQKFQKCLSDFDLEGEFFKKLENYAEFRSDVFGPSCQCDQTRRRQFDDKNKYSRALSPDEKENENPESKNKQKRSQQNN